MQRGICYRAYVGRSPPSATAGGGGAAADLKRVVEESAVVVFAQRGCCMSHVVRRLLQSLGANPAVYEVDERDADGLAGELAEAGGGGGLLLIKLPAVFIGGRWFGGTERVITALITEELIPLLKQAGALWL